TTKKFEEKVRGFVNKEAIEKIGSDLKTLSLSTLTTVVNAVVPPISQYEVVEVWLSHDMVGYVGLESLTFSQALPVSWLDVPYEENEWVEAKMVSVIKLAVQSIAQDYVWHRMTATDGQNQSNVDNSNIAS
ncbi:13626_t:CDS:2, partial [Dentiscutata heterogama]